MIRQLYNLLLLMTISIMTLAPFACVDDPRNPPPPPGGSSASNGETGNNDSTGLEPPSDSSGGGEQCMEEWDVYQCRGVIIPYYHYMNGGAGTSVYFEGMDPDGVGPKLPVDKYLCSDNIFVAAPSADNPDNPGIFEACRSKCDEEKGDLTFSASVGPYNFSGTVECVFEPNAHGGVPNVANVYGTQAADCPWIDNVAPIQPEQQNLYDRDATPEDCQSLSCGDWDPEEFVVWNYNTSTHVHTTVLPTWFLDELLEDQAGRLYVCDESRFYDAWVNGAPKGWIYAVGGDVLYEMGFRTNDYKVTIQRSGAGNTVYPLDTSAQRVTAMVGLAIGGSFVVKFRRPTGGTYVTHTMNLTIPAA